MDDEITPGQRKSEVVADAINRLLSELAIKCAKEEGVRDYFHVSMIGYGGNVGPAFGGLLAGQRLIPLSDVASNPQRVETRSKKVPDGAGGLANLEVKFPIWLDPTANGGTPMVKALDQAESIVREWLVDHPTCFPPVVLNLTDGESTDGDPSNSSANVRSLTSTDGATLLFNLHVSSGTATPITFPDDAADLQDEYARLLFGMSSNLPTHMRTYAGQQGIPVTEGSRGFVFNADVTSLVQFLDIGTRASDLR